MRVIKPSKVVFSEEKLEKEFNELSEDSEIKKYIKRAIEDIKRNAFCAIPIPKKLIPKEYTKKYGINNLWKYDLPNGWRIVYSIITPNKIEIISLILEWFDYKKYEKRFKY